MTKSNNKGYRLQSHLKFGAVCIDANISALDRETIDDIQLIINEQTHGLPETWPIVVTVSTYKTKTVYEAGWSYWASLESNHLEYRFRQPHSVEFSFDIEVTKGFVQNIKKLDQLRRDSRHKGLVHTLDAHVFLSPYTTQIPRIHDVLEEVDNITNLDRYELAFWFMTHIAHEHYAEFSAHQGTTAQERFEIEVEQWIAHNPGVSAAAHKEAAAAFKHATELALDENFDEAVKSFEKASALWNLKNASQNVLEPAPVPEIPKPPKVSKSSKSKSHKKKVALVASNDVALPESGVLLENISVPIETLEPSVQAETPGPTAPVETLLPEPTVNTLEPIAPVDTLAPEPILTPELTVNTLEPGAPVETLSPESVETLTPTLVPPPSIATSDVLVTPVDASPVQEMIPAPASKDDEQPSQIKNEVPHEESMPVSSESNVVPSPADNDSRDNVIDNCALSANKLDAPH